MLLGVCGELIKVSPYAVTIYWCLFGLTIFIYLVVSFRKRK